MCISKHGRKKTRQHPQPPPPLPRPWPLSRVKSRLLGLQTFRVLSIAVALNRLFSRPLLFPFSMDKFQSQPRSSSNPVTACCDPHHPCPSPPTSADWISLPSLLCTKDRTRLWQDMISACVADSRLDPSLQLCAFRKHTHTHTHTHTHMSYRVQYCGYVGELRIQTV